MEENQQVTKSKQNITITLKKPFGDITSIEYKDCSGHQVGASWVAVFLEGGDKIEIVNAYQVMAITVVNVKEVG